MKILPVGLVRLGLVLIITSTAVAGEVGFVEDFALTKDRAGALKQLIPGTEDYYYYHALLYLQTEQFEKADALTKPWLERFGQTPRLTETQTRFALLTYERNPNRALTYLRQHLHLSYNHQRLVPGGVPNLPTALDANLIARATLQAGSFARWGLLENFEDSALDWLAAENLPPERRRNLLQRLHRPDVPNLPRLVVDDLNIPNSPGYGAYPVHTQMTLDQLAELFRMKPILLNQTAYVQATLTKLQPGADEDWRHDPALTRAYFDRLLAFARRLAPAHNALKAHVLYHRLVLDRSRGAYDKTLLVEYLRLPRQRPYLSKALRESDEARRFPADLGADFQAATLLRPVGDDESLVRSCLLHFLATANSAREFEPFIDDIYLRHLFAEAKITGGLGEPEQWAAELPPEMFRHLKERVDVDFAFTNKTLFAADEPVRLDLELKNAPTLIVKVFEINAQNYYREHKAEIDTDINLDGLVPSSEQTLTSTESPLRRVAKRFDFPQLTKPGVYVVDFIGGGKSSRALVRKGRLRPLVATGTAGQVVTVIDDANHVVKDATVSLGGQEYQAVADGRIIVPFSTAPGRQPIVIARGGFASLAYLDHQPEAYALAAGIHVDREALLARRTAVVLIRPGLTLNGSPVSIKLLENVKLRLVSTDLAGIATTAEIPNFKVFEDRESTHEFRVPDRLASLHIELTADVKSLTRGAIVSMAAGETFTLNGIDKTDKIEDLHLAKFGPDYAIELLGRTGEAKPDRPVHLSIKHRDFKEPVQVTLKSDARGQVHLGPLADILNVRATGPEGTAEAWTLPTDRHTYRQFVHARAGDVVTLPDLGAAAAPSRAELALFEVRENLIYADRFDALAIKDGLLELRGLEPGDYDLYLKRSDEFVRVRVVAGDVVAGHVLGKLRDLELAPLKPVQIASAALDGETVTVRLRDASPFTRVHVFATRYRPAYSAFDDLSKVQAAELSGVYPSHAESAYLTGRNIGDEYRYVLDRKYQKKYPGNMLSRPELLLNPWAVRSTETGEQQAQAGEEFKPAGTPPPAAAAGSARPLLSLAGVDARGFVDLDFLADAAAVLVNLVPDKDGVVKLDRKDVGPHALVHIVAVDPLGVTARFLSLPEPPAKVLDLRLRAGLDPQGHFTQQKQVSLLTPGQPLIVADVAGSRFEAYDSLAKVYGLYATLGHDPKFAEFAFLLNWPKLTIEEKRAQYSKYACHESNFFLAMKDQVFFREVVKPLLANKKDKTFLDHWLLEDNLAGNLDPWRYDHLNAVERVLLAKRITGEPGKTARHLSDLLRLQPPNGDRLLVLFETALKSGALANENILELEKGRSAREKFFMQGLNDAEGADPVNRAIREDKAGGGRGYTGGTTTFGGVNQPAPATAGFKAAPKGDLNGTELKKAADSPRRSGATRAQAAKELEAFDKSGELRALEGQQSFLGDDREQLGRARQLFRRVDPTQEWAENNYYHLPTQHQVAELVPPGPFWLDYAKHEGKAPFLSKNLADAARNFTEAMLALAVLDLPFDAPKPDVKFDGGKMTFTPAGPAIAFHEEVRPTGGPGGKLSVLVSQNIYRQGDRYRDEDGERLDKFVTGEFVAQTVYGCQVVVTNPSPSRQRLTVLVQVPVGAVPVAGAQYTRSVPLDLEPYRTQTVDYLFYFPRPGRFVHFPAHVAKNETLVASTPPMTFEVVGKPTKPDTESWEYVSQNGTTEQVVAFLNRENTSALDLDKIAFRMGDKTVFTAVLDVLRARHVYQPTLWSYGLLHNALPAAREFLLHADTIVAECGGPIESPLLTVDPVARHLYEHLEYKPLVNARAHALGQRRQIVNGRFNEQYHHYLGLLSRKPRLGDDDRLAVVYYLLLQDRVDEALTTFAEVNPERLATRLQYDYCAAYLAMYGDEPQKARVIADKYLKHPVDRWRNTFAAIVNELDEAEGKGPAVAHADNRDQRQAEAAAKEPAFELTLAGKTFELTWQNVETVTVNYYLMDVELLFSRNPFVQQFGSQFSSIRPNATGQVKLPAAQGKQAISLPAELAGRNVLVEVSAGGKTRSLPYYANAMDVRLMENYGQVRAADAAGKPLPKVYVKVYARLANGQVKFHKDGYTDLRGRFDYASVSTPEPQPIICYAVLVLSDDRGALIREANPPAQ